MRVLEHHDVGQAAPAQSYICAGTVVSWQPGTNVIDVRIGRTGNRVVRNVVLPFGLYPDAGDTVLVAHTPTDTPWIAICRVMDRDRYGLSVATTQAENELHPPTGFTVFAVDSLLVAEWQGWAGNSLCFLVQHNSVGDDDGNEVDFYTRGSYLLYRTTTAITRYFRCCTVRYDVDQNEAWYSAWTSWQGATSAPAATAANLDGLEQGLLHHMHEVDWMWTKHITGALP